MKCYECPYYIKTHLGTACYVGLRILCPDKIEVRKKHQAIVRERTRVRRLLDDFLSIQRGEKRELA